MKKYFILTAILLVLISAIFSGCKPAREKINQDSDTEIIQNEQNGEITEKTRPPFYIPRLNREPRRGHGQRPEPRPMPRFIR